MNEQQREALEVLRWLEQCALPDPHDERDVSGGWLADKVFAAAPALRTYILNSTPVPEGWRALAERIHEELAVIDDSEGIAGYHLNGDLSTWDEWELPDLRSELGRMLDAAPTPEDGHG